MEIILLTWWKEGQKTSFSFYFIIWRLNGYFVSWCRHPCLSRVKDIVKWSELCVFFIPLLWQIRNYASFVWSFLLLWPIMYPNPLNKSSRRGQGQFYFPTSLLNLLQKNGFRVKLLPLRKKTNSFTKLSCVLLEKEASPDFQFFWVETKQPPKQVKFSILMRFMPIGHIVTGKVC